MKKKVLVIIFVLLAVIVGAATLYSMLGEQVEPETSVAEQAGGAAQSDGDSEAPDFKVYDEEGIAFTLADFEGKPAILNFWASWCGPCKSEMPVFDEAYSDYGDEISFVMINLTDGSSETQESAMDFINGEGYDFPVYFDLDGTAQVDYEAYSIPVTYFVDAGGNIAAHASGALDAETLKKGINMILE